MIDNNFDISSYTKSIVGYMLDTMNHLTGNTIVNNNLNFNLVYISTDNGFLFTSKTYKTLFRVDFNEKITYDKRSDFLYSGWCFLMQNRVEIYDRKYSSIIDIFAKLGGGAKAVLIIGSLINHLNYQYIFFRDIQNSVDNKVNEEIENGKAHSQKVKRIKFATAVKSKQQIINDYSSPSHVFFSNCNLQNSHLSKSIKNKKSDVNINNKTIKRLTSLTNYDQYLTVFYKRKNKIKFCNFIISIICCMKRTKTNKKEINKLVKSWKSFISEDFYLKQI